MPEPLPAPDYYASPALGSTALRIAATSSVAHFLAQQHEDTDALRLGRLTHCATLEPERFAERYASPAVQPCAGGKEDKQGRPGKCSRQADPGAAHCWQHGGREEAAAYLATLPPGTEPISLEEREQALAAAEGIRFQLKRLGLLEVIEQQGRFEVPLFGRAHLKEESPGYFLTVETLATPGLPVRGKIDVLLPGLALDLKGTHALPSPRSWAWRVKDKGLRVQAALYADLVELHYGTAPRWLWLVHESAKPFGCRLYECDPGLLDSGRKLLAEGLRRWQVYRETGDAWAGWPADIAMVWEPRGWGEE